MDIEKIKVGDVIHDIRDAGALREIEGKGLSTNDYTNEDKSKLEGIEADAQKNKIESIKVNGSDVTPDPNKVVNVTVPTKMSDLNLDGGNMASGASLRFNNASSSMVIQPFGIVKESNESSHVISFPDKQGTVALTSDIPDVSSKQDTIQDLETIRSGAAKGETSVQPLDIEGMVKAEPIGSIIPPVNPSQFATKEEVSQLGQEKLDKSRIEETIPWNLAENATILNQKYFNASGGLIDSVNYFVVSGIPVTPGETIYFYCQKYGETYSSTGYNNKITARALRLTDGENDVTVELSYKTSPYTIPSNVVLLDIAFPYMDTTTMETGVYWVTRKAENEHEDTEVLKESFKEEVLGTLPGEVSHLNDAVENVTSIRSNLVIDKNVEMEGGYLNTSTGLFTPSTGSQKTTDYIPLEVGPLYTLDYSGAPDQNLPRAVCIYKDDKTFSRSITVNASTMAGFAISTGEKYIRINVNTTEVFTLDLYQTLEGKSTQILATALDVTAIDKINDAILPTRGGNYIHARRPTIAFMIDAGHEYDDERLSIFEKHGYRVGLAYGWTQFSQQFIAANKSLLINCLEKQDAGHEILTHLYYLLNDNTPYDDVTAIGYIKQSIDVMSSVGFKVRGAIGRSGAVATRFLPTIKNCYTWASTAPNKSGETTPYFSFGDADPYVLSRYSMQLSTVAQQKAAIDAAIANNGLLLFYGHAESVEDYFNDASLDEVLTYLDTKVAEHQCQVLLPSDAVSDYFSVRYQDVVNLLIS